MSNLVKNTLLLKTADYRATLWVAVVSWMAGMTGPGPSVEPIQPLRIQGASLSDLKALKLCSFRFTLEKVLSASLSFISFFTKFFLQQCLESLSAVVGCVLFGEL